MRYLLASVLLFTSCVSPAQLSSSLSDFEAGLITREEFLEENSGLAGRIPPGGIPTDPLSLVLYAGGALATAMGTNKFRDRRRRQRGEETGSGGTRRGSEPRIEPLLEPSDT